MFRRGIFVITLSLLLPFAVGVAAEEGSQEDVALKQIDQQIDKAGVDTSASGWRTKLPKPTMATFPADTTYVAKMETTKGPIEIRLMPDVAPMHVTSFIYLTRLGFYDGLSFHRVIPGFMAQGGCPLGTGTGGPGYKYDGEFKSDVKHDKPGLLSMANAGPGTDGSQFFLTFVPTPWLDGKHTIYGEVIDGMETLKALEAIGSRDGRPTEPVSIEKVTIEVR
jgi:cyclophilin family peptidyl-prolyl cis-trans isomerase